MRCSRPWACSDEPNGKFLLYAPTEDPDYEDDWPLDIRLYSRGFRADKASILLRELGLLNQHPRTHVALRRKFFDAKDRLQKIKSLVAPDASAADLDRKLIAVVAKADQPDLFNLARALIAGENHERVFGETALARDALFAFLPGAGRGGCGSPSKGRLP
ncbi:MAG TPA: hypothetical protein VMV69_29240 [Pirellulales bacterium]|nr:hypothetical protein [Pirellulales bacterium]